MKPFLWLSVFICAATILPAQTNTAVAGHPRKTASRKATVSPEVQALREAVAAQQQQIQQQHQEVEELKSQLQQVLAATQRNGADLEKVGSNVTATQATAEEAQRSASEAKRVADEAVTNAGEVKTALAVVNTKSQEEGKKISLLETLGGRIRFTGDVRVRGESFFQDCAACVDRNRGRMRVRFGVEGKAGEDFTGGLMLTSGSLGDSNSTNETFTNFFTRKSIGIDRAYVTWQPSVFKWLSLTGGKFSYTWQRTPVTFDSDLNPEGFTQKVSFNLKSPVVKNISFQGIQLLYSENSKGNDSFAVGGQVASRLEFGPVTSTPSFTVLNWRFVDAILGASGFAVQAPGEGPGCATGTGLPTTAPCVYSPQGFTNATFRDSAGALHFLSGFLYGDFILNNSIKTPWERFPATLVLEFQDNLNAAAHPVNAAGVSLVNLGSQSHAYSFDFSLGQTKNKNDLQIGYSWLRQEQDSVLASFTESELRAPTNLLQNRIYASWKMRPNTVASYTLWIGRTLNSNLQHAILAPGNTAGEADPYLKRMQFDVIYSF